MLRLGILTQHVQEVLRVATVILKCTCKHDYQDRRYGKQKRVFNVMRDGKARCTVCAAERLPKSRQGERI